VNLNVVVHMWVSPIDLDMLLYNFKFLEPFPDMIISYDILFTIILVKRILLSVVMNWE